MRLTALSIQAYLNQRPERQPPSSAVNADILILQEVDLNARHTHRLNIAEMIASKLEMN
jgi:endonuclease/exonuclease/phosphatase family metal-dependent hydrolase